MVSGVGRIEVCDPRLLIPSRVKTQSAECGAWHRAHATKRLTVTEAGDAVATGKEMDLRWRI